VLLRGSARAPVCSAQVQPTLETHHAAMTLALLGRPELDFLCKLPPAEKQRFVDGVRDVILATDVTTSAPRAKEFRAAVEGGEPPTAGQVVSLIIKAADISNPARRLAVYNRWIDVRAALPTEPEACAPPRHVPPAGGWPLARLLTRSERTHAHARTPTPAQPSRCRSPPDPALPRCRRA
jgi:hypothetical protein